MRKKYIAFFLAMIFALGLFFPLANVFAKDGVVTGSLVNLRNGPGTEFERVGQAKKDDVLKIIEEKGKWYKVALKDKEAWIVEDYFSVDEAIITGNDSNKPVVDQGQAKVLVNSDFLNGYQVRGNSKSEIVTRYSKGDELRIALERGQWSLVQSQKGSGWVKTMFLKIPDRPFDNQGYIKGKTVNVRENSGTEYEIVTRLAKGDAVTILNEKYDWYEILTANGERGWVSGSLLNFGKDNLVKPDEKPVIEEKPSETIESPKEDFTETPVKYSIVVQGSVVNVREYPSTQAAVVGKVANGTNLMALAESNNGWLKVNSAEGKIGWIAGWLTEKKVDDPGIGDEVKNIRIPLGNGANIFVDNRQDRLQIYLSPCTEKEYEISKSLDGKSLIIKSEDDLTNLNQVINNWGLKNIQIERNLVAINFKKEFSFLPVYQNNDQTMRLSITYPNDGLVSVKNVVLSPSENTSVIQIETDTKLVYKTEKIAYNKIALDLQKSHLALENKSQREQEVGFGPIKAVEVKQKEKGVVRLEITYDEESITSINQQADYIVFVAKYKKQSAFPGSVKGKTIVIDPGHGDIRAGGWVAPGAIGRDLQIKEVDVNLSVGLKVRDLLQAQGANVLMTHSTGRTPLSLAARGHLANNSGADIFVSIHSNSSVNRGIEGSTVYYYAPLDSPKYIHLAAQREERKKLSQSLLDGILNTGQRKNLGVREGNYAVLRESNVPSALVEMAFISNPEEELLLADDQFRMKMAQGIVQGIQEYFKNN